MIDVSDVMDMFIICIYVTTSLFQGHLRDAFDALRVVPFKFFSVEVGFSTIEMKMDEQRNKSSLATIK